MPLTERQKAERYDAAVRLAELQARDDGVWFNPRYITESYLQQCLRDLHRVLETGEEPEDYEPAENVPD